MSASDSQAAVASEDELGVKWDRCVADAVIKTGVLSTWFKRVNILINAHQTP